MSYNRDFTATTTDLQLLDGALPALLADGLLTPVALDEDGAAGTEGGAVRPGRHRRRPAPLQLAQHVPLGGEFERDGRPLAPRPLRRLKLRVHR